MMSREGGEVRVGDTFERTVEPGVLWAVTQIAPGLVRAEKGPAALRVARLESGPDWAFETLDRLVSGNPWRRVQPCAASAATHCTGRGDATCW